MILQGQNAIDDRFFEKTTTGVCLGRIELPILPLKRQLYRSHKVYMGEREAPVASNFHSTFSSSYVERVRLIHKSLVAFKVTDITAGFIGQTQYIYGQVESCGIAPNLRSILRTERMEKLCFMPRVILRSSSDYAGGFEVVELITFDLVPYQSDETLDRRPPTGACAQLR